MTATPEQHAEALDPATSPAGLAVLATEPELWPAIAAHPNAYPDLLDYLGQYGDAATQAALAARRAVPAPPEPQAASAAPATAEPVEPVAVAVEPAPFMAEQPAPQPFPAASHQAAPYGASYQQPMPAQPGMMPPGTAQQPVVFVHGPGRKPSNAARNLGVPGSLLVILGLLLAAGAVWWAYSLGLSDATISDISDTSDSSGSLSGIAGALIGIAILGWAGLGALVLGGLLLLITLCIARLAAGSAVARGIGAVIAIAGVVVGAIVVYPGVQIFTIGSNVISSFTSGDVLSAGLNALSGYASLMSYAKFYVDLGEIGTYVMAGAAVVLGLVGSLIVLVSFAGRRR